MNYSKLKTLQTRTQLSDVKFAKSIGMTDVGYKRMLDKQTCTVERLENICKVYNLELSFFFEASSNKASESVVSFGSCRECEKKEAVIETLKGQLKQKDEEIASLNRELGGLDESKRARTR